MKYIKIIPNIARELLNVVKAYRAESPQQRKLRRAQKRYDTARDREDVARREYNSYRNILESATRQAADARKREAAQTKQASPSRVQVEVTPTAEETLAKERLAAATLRLEKTGERMKQARDKLNTIKSSTD